MSERKDALTDLQQVRADLLKANAIESDLKSRMTTLGQCRFDLITRIYGSLIPEWSPNSDVEWARTSELAVITSSNAIDVKRIGNAVEHMVKYDKLAQEKIAQLISQREEDLELILGLREEATGS